jgi:hypothetical protein
VRLGQAVLLAAGAAAAVAVLDLAPSAGGAVGATLMLGAAVALATLPVAGGTAEEWAPVLATYMARRISRRTEFRAPIPVLGARWGRGRPLGRPAPHPPGTLSDVEIIEVAYRGRQVGALGERGGRRMTAVLACEVVSFALLDPDAQERRLARWGNVLASAAGTPIRRLQWIERTAPAQADELARWLHDARDPAIPLRGSPMIESYLELIGASTTVAHDHEILVAVQVDVARLSHGRREALGAALVEQAERVALGLEAAEIRVLGALSPGQLGRCLRTAFDPYARGELTAVEAVDAERDGVTAADAWPLAVREGWEQMRCDGALHATFWISGWPRVEVSPMFMDAMLGHSGAVRSVAVTFEPVSPQRSTREVEAAITRDRADSELRRRFGQAETARQRQAHEAALRREQELAAGHAEVRLAGFVTVSGRDEQELRRACSEVIEHAARARLELRRMYGQQAEAFTFTLPLARGLR